MAFFFFFLTAVVLTNAMHLLVISPSRMLASRELRTPGLCCLGQSLGHNKYRHTSFYYALL